MVVGLEVVVVWEGRSGCDGVDRGEGFRSSFGMAEGGHVSFCSVCVSFYTRVRVSVRIFLCFFMSVRVCLLLFFFRFVSLSSLLFSVSLPLPLCLYLLEFLPLFTFRLKSGSF